MKIAKENSWDKTKTAVFVMTLDFSKIANAG